MTTPTTRELLEGAARACGHTFKWVELNGVETLCVPSLKSLACWRKWDPLTNMADCFEMETELGINIRWHRDCVEVWHGMPVNGHLEALADHNNDRKAARMYASTRCAFEISKGM